MSVACGDDPGPVHLNLPFRENLAPDSGVVRGAWGTHDAAASSTWDRRILTAEPRFAEWRFDTAPLVRSAGTLSRRGASSAAVPPEEVMNEVAAALAQSRRGIVVVGRLTSPQERAAALWLAASVLRWPMFADIQSGLRGEDGGVLVERYEQLLSQPLISRHARPDVVLQLGAPVVSAVLQRWLTLVDPVTDTRPVHILVAPGAARIDPERSVTHRLNCGADGFGRALHASPARLAHRLANRAHFRGSALLSLVRLSRAVADPALMRALPRPALNEAARTDNEETEEAGALTEPLVARIVTTELGAHHPTPGLFLSSSMPVRDVDAFSTMQGTHMLSAAPACNRGASGIDGVISTAMGYAAAQHRPVVLLIGDQAALHDVGALHALGLGDGGVLRSPSRLVTVVVNNGGGGIFSFLPVSRTVSRENVFEPLFGAAHNTSLEGVARSFGLDYRRCDSGAALRSACKEALQSAQDRHVLIEAAVSPSRDANALLHRELSSTISAALRTSLIGSPPAVQDGLSSMTKRRPHDYGASGALRLRWRRSGNSTGPPLLLLHGWMGSNEDWGPFLQAARDDSAANGANSVLKCDIIAIELPGHGDSGPDEESLAPTSLLYSFEATVSNENRARAPPRPSRVRRLRAQVEAILVLLDRLRPDQRDPNGNQARVGVLGYSMGGRVALALAERLQERNGAALVLLSAHLGLGADAFAAEGDILPEAAATVTESAARLMRRDADEALASRVEQLSAVSWDQFLRDWYAPSMWGSLQQDAVGGFDALMARRRCNRPRALAASLRGLSLSSMPSFWHLAKHVDERDGSTPPAMLYVAGARDDKYAAFAKHIAESADNARAAVLEDAGHALLEQVSRPHALASHPCSRSHFRLTNSPRPTSALPRSPSSPDLS